MKTIDSFVASSIFLFEPPCTLSCAFGKFIEIHFNQTTQQLLSKHLGNQGIPALFWQRVRNE